MLQQRRLSLPVRRDQAVPPTRLQRELRVADQLDIIRTYGELRDLDAIAH